MNLIHSIEKKKQTPEAFYAAIEITAGSSAKYEIDHESGALILDRFLYTATHYPHNYGFIPRTYADDGDPLDVLVISSGPIVPLALVYCRPIGMIKMVDGGRGDAKILAVPFSDPFYGQFSSIQELPDHVEEEITHFFSVYKELEHGKSTSVEGYMGPKEAQKVIAECRRLYDETFPEYQ